MGELARVAARCDGVRCDMAMLVLPDVFRRTWGERAIPRDGSAPVDRSFWPDAISRVRTARPGFLFMAEVYWDLEWTLQQQGFDFTYDKRLYDRLHGSERAPSGSTSGRSPSSRSARRASRTTTSRAPRRRSGPAIGTARPPSSRSSWRGSASSTRVSSTAAASTSRCTSAGDRTSRRIPDPGLLRAAARGPPARGGPLRRLAAIGMQAGVDGNPTSDQFVLMAWEGAQGAFSSGELRADSGAVLGEGAPRRTRGKGASPRPPLRRDLRPRRRRAASEGVSSTSLPGGITVFAVEAAGPDDEARTT